MMAYPRGIRMAIKRPSERLPRRSFTFRSRSFPSLWKGSAEKRERARERKQRKEKEIRARHPPIFRSSVYNRDHPISVIAVYGEEPPLIPSYPRWPGDEKPRGRWTGLAVSSGFHSIKGERVTFSLSSRSRVSSRREERRWRRRKGGYAAAETRPSVRARFPAARES